MLEDEVPCYESVQCRAIEGHSEICQTRLDMMQASVQERLVDSSGKPARHICTADRWPHACHCFMASLRLLLQLSMPVEMADACLYLSWRRLLLVSA